MDIKVIIIVFILSNYFWLPTSSLSEKELPTLGNILYAKLEQSPTRSHGGVVMKRIMSIFNNFGPEISDANF